MLISAPSDARYKGMNCIQTRLFGVIVALTLAAATGCRPSIPPSAASAVESAGAGVVAGGGMPDEQSPRSPGETVSAIQSARRDGDYKHLAPLIAPELRQATVEFLRAVDGVLAANSSLQETSAARYHGALAGRWDLAAMRNNLGPFSESVSVIREVIDGDRAVVTLQEGDHVPLYHASFERADGGWLYRPEPIPPGTVREMNRLARILADVGESMSRGAPYREIDEAFRFRVLPQIVRVRQLERASVAAAEDVGG